MSKPTNTEQSIFLAALEIESPDERAKFLDTACGADSEQRAEVEALLRANEKTGDLLDAGVPAGLATVDYSAPERPGSQIGPYKLREEIGQGGMGLVWAAEQKKPLRRKVALKVIKPGMDSQAVIARFEVEREALALMDHPNIARVLDAGTTDQGRPYFVMELIRGIAITKYCDAAKMSVRERLDLFIQVCSAVQHAHQKGIIHRDIKPPNVLVTEQDGTPLPKVIDFGVAKALHQPLTERSIYTGVQQAIGTLPYMSPEQAAPSARDVDTRADVYGLGVLLYELLTGATPFDPKQLENAALDEACRVIREQDPPKPSTKISTLGERATAVSLGRGTDPSGLGKAVRGDLDWIAMKALEKDRSRRYETAAAFAADVRHYLDDEPIRARPPSTVYRLRKFARKHRAGLATACLVLFVLFVALVGISSFAIRTNALAEDLERERQNAVAEAERANQEAERANRLLRHLRERLFDEGMSDILSGNLEAAKEKIAALRKFGAEGEDLAEIVNAFSLILSGDYKKAIEIARSGIDSNPGSIAYRAILETAYNRSGDMAKAFEVRRALVQMDPPTTFEDKFFLSSIPSDSNLDSFVKSLDKRFESQPSPVRLLWLAASRAHLARATGQVELADQSVQESNAVKVFLRLKTGEVRSLCLKTALCAASAAIVSGQDGERYLRDAEDVVEAIDRANAPTYLERFYRALYHYEMGHPETARSLHRKDAEAMNDLAGAHYLALASELNESAKDEYLDKIVQEPTAFWTRWSLMWYRLLRGEDQLADDVFKDSPSQSLGELGTRVSFLMATDRQQEAMKLARKGLEDHGNQSADRVSYFWAKVYLPSVAGNWDDDRVRTEASRSPYSQVLAYAHFHLALKYYGKGEWSTARKHFEECRAARLLEEGTHAWSRAFLAKLDPESR